MLPRLLKDDETAMTKMRLAARIFVIRSSSARPHPTRHRCAGTKKHPPQRERVRAGKAYLPSLRR